MQTKIIEVNPQHPEKEKIKNEQIELLDRLKLSEDIIGLLDIVKEFAYLRLNIRLKWVHAGFLTKKVLEEIGHRTDTKLKELEYYTLNEMQSLLIDNKKIDPIIIIERKKYAFILDGNRLSLYLGDKSDEIENQELEKVDFDSIKELKGNVANPGKVTGRVRIINSLVKDQEKAIEEMIHGEILVTGMTRPHLVEAMQKSGAIITDEGGITSHAAIVCRELGVPCIVGTKIATKVLKDGDLIEVDADEGIVRKIG